MNSQETLVSTNIYTDECCLPDVAMQKWKCAINLYIWGQNSTVAFVDSVLTLVLINIAMVTISRIWCDFYLWSAAGLQTFDVAMVAKGV